MRFLFLLFIFFKFQAQQTFVEFEGLTTFPERTYDSLSRYTIILLGEMHGTKEAPGLTKSLADLFSLHKKVIIALEIPDENQKVIDAYLRSGDEKLMAQIDFFKEVRDGRASEAMADLIKTTYGKTNVRIVCFDVTLDKDAQGYRDSMMALSIISIQKSNPDAVIISLSGNIHSNVNMGFRKGYETMGYYLKQAFGSSLLSLNIRYRKGRAFNCMSGSCRDRAMEEDTSPFKEYLKTPAYLLIDRGFDVTGINGIIYLKEITASQPYIPF